MNDKNADRVCPDSEEHRLPACYRRELADDVWPRNKTSQWGCKEFFGRLPKKDRFSTANPSFGGLAACAPQNLQRYGRGRGVRRGLGVGVTLGAPVGVGVAVALGVAVAVAVAVGVGLGGGVIFGTIA